MTRKPVTLGDLSFGSQTAADEHFKSILNRYELEQELNAEDHADVVSLLANHPNAKAKIGVGIRTLKVSATEYPSNRCFHIVRVDGSVENFSKEKCIKGDHSDLRKFYVACRKAVDPELRNFKDQDFQANSASDGRVKCQATGDLIAFDESHVDHREPYFFSIIVHFFIDANEIDLSSIQYDTEGQYGNRFADQDLEKRFQDYHRKHAKLRVIAARKNLGKAHLGRLKSTKGDSVLKQ